MSTKDSCKFHDIKNNNNNQFNITKKKILIQKNYTKVFVFLLKNCQSEWKIFGVGLVVVVVVLYILTGSSPIWGIWILNACCCFMSTIFFFIYFSKTFIYIIFFVIVVVSFYSVGITKQQKQFFFVC